MNALCEHQKTAVGLFALLLIAGINTGNATLIVVAFVVLLLIAVLVIPKIKQIKKQTKQFQFDKGA